MPTELPPLVGEVSADFCALRGVSWSARRIPKVIFSVFLTGAATFHSKELLNCTHEVECSPFQTDYFSGNLVAPGIEPGASGSVARNSDYRSGLNESKHV
jgi:hypothetical protein